MRRPVRDALVVLFVLAGIALAVLAYFWFSGRVETGRRKQVVVMFDDVTGLRVGDPVEVMGLPKGKVIRLGLDARRIRCRVALDRDVEMSEDTRFAIRSVSYLGSDRYLMVTLAPGPGVGAGYVFEGTNEALDLEETFLKLERLLTELDVSGLADELKDELKGVLGDVREQFGLLGSQLGRVGEGFRATNGQLGRLATTFDSLAGLLRTESTAGRLLASDELYQEIRQTNQVLQALMSDIKQNPRRYFKVSIF